MTSRYTHSCFKISVPMYNATVGHTDFQASIAASFVSVCRLREFSLSAATNNLKMPRESKSMGAIVTKCPYRLKFPNQ